MSDSKIISFCSKKEYAKEAEMASSVTYQKLYDLQKSVTYLIEANKKLSSSMEELANINLILSKKLFEQSNFMQSIIGVIEKLTEIVTKK